MYLISSCGCPLVRATGWSVAILTAVYRITPSNKSLGYAFCSFASASRSQEGGSGYERIMVSHGLEVRDG